MTIRDLGRTISRPSGGPFDLGTVEDVLWNERPPELLMEGGNRVRIAGPIGQYNPGDTVLYVPMAPKAVAVGKLPIVGVGSPIEDEEDAEALDPWVSPTYLNGWEDYGDGVFDVGGYYRGPDYWVRLKGLVRLGTDLADIFVLPEGYRPPFTCYMLTLSADQPAAVAVEPDGSVKKIGGGNNSWVSLNGITFPSRWNPYAWSRPVFSNNWRHVDALTDADVKVFVRDDGWCWITGCVNSGSTGARMFTLPDNARTYYLDIMKGLSLAPQRYDIGGSVASFERGVGSWSHAGGNPGNNATQYLGGNSWWAQQAPPELFTPLTFDNGWVNFPSLGAYRPCEFFRDHLNVVNVHGVAHAGSATSNFIAQLPVGYRPAMRQVFYSLRNPSGTQCRIDVYADGWIEIQNVRDTGFVSLSSISFRAMQ